MLYELRSGPKKWGEHRDKLLKELVVEQDGMKATLEQTNSCRNVWLVRDQEGNIVARLMVYVDDVLITGPEGWINTIMKGFQSL